MDQGFELWKQIKTGQDLRALGKEVAAQPDVLLKLSPELQLASIAGVEVHLITEPHFGPCIDALKALNGSSIAPAIPFALLDSPSLSRFWRRVFESGEHIDLLFERYTQQDNAFIVSSLLWGLQRFGKPEVLAKFIAREVCYRPNDNLLEAIEECADLAIPKISTWLGDKSIAIRNNAAKALKTYPRKTSVHALESQLEVEKSKKVAKTITLALKACTQAPPPPTAITQGELAWRHIGADLDWDSLKNLEQKSVADLSDAQLLGAVLYMYFEDSGLPEWIKPALLNGSVAKAVPYALLEARHNMQRLWCGLFSKDEHSEILIDSLLNTQLTRKGRLGWYPGYGFSPYYVVQTALGVFGRSGKPIPDRLIRGIARVLCEGDNSVSKDLKKDVVEIMPVLRDAIATYLDSQKTKERSLSAKLLGWYPSRLMVKRIEERLKIESSAAVKKVLKRSLVLCQNAEELLKVNTQ